MSSLKQPAQKRPRCESNNNYNTCISPNTNTNINLLSLPEEALNNILSYSLPQKECQVWEWIGILSQTCTSLRKFAHTYAPTRIVLKDFRYYTRPNYYDYVDVRVEFLQSLLDHKWKRQHLKEFHVNDDAVIRVVEEEGRLRPREECNEIKALLRTLLTTPSSFPELEWLDTELQSDEVHLIDAESLRVILAFPALQKLCLCSCFKQGIREISPQQLRQFCTNLQMPLTSLSLAGPEWMTDSHIEAIMPIIGKNLVRLELVDCSAWDHESPIDSEDRLLSDISIISIGQHCKKLKSFSMTTSSITCRGLERLLSANTGITTLNLSDSQQLNTRVVDIISRYLPRLEVLRNYWPNKREPDWLTDDSLIALVDAQESLVVQVSF